MDGDVIGINTAILGPSGNIGIGFSIPSNNAKRVISQLIEFGETKRGWLGVRIQEVTEEIAEVEKLEGTVLKEFIKNKEKLIFRKEKDEILDNYSLENQVNFLKNEIFFFVFIFTL